MNGEVVITPDGPMTREDFARTGAVLLGQPGYTGDTAAYEEELRKAVKLVRRTKTVGLPVGLSLLHRGGTPLRKGRKDTLAKKHGAVSDVKGVLEPVTTTRKNGVGRNSPCPCGSGLKNKHCRCR